MEIILMLFCLGLLGYVYLFLWQFKLLPRRVAYWPTRRKSIQLLPPNAPLSFDKLLRLVNEVDESYSVKEEDGWFYSTLRPATPKPRYHYTAIFRRRLLSGGPLPLVEMTDAVRKAASAGKSVLFVVDAPQSDMLQKEFLWELTEAFANCSKPSSPRSNKPLYIVFLQPQRLADFWPDACNGRLLHCNECSETQVDDAPGMDGPVLVDVYHLPLVYQVLMTVELFFAREHYADRVTSVRITCGGCRSLADNGDASAALTVVGRGRTPRNRLGCDQKATDVYSEAFKFLHRSELDACELVGRRWFQHIRTVAAVLPLHHIPSAVISHSPETLRCELLEPQRRRKTRTFNLTGGQPADLNGLRNSHIGTMLIDEKSDLIIAMLSDWFKVEVNRTTAKNLLIPIPPSLTNESSVLQLSNVLNGAQPRILQLAFDSTQRDFRHIGKTLSEAVPTAKAQLIVIKWAMRENRHLLDFAMRSRRGSLLLLSTESMGQDADWFVMTLIELFQHQMNLGALRQPLYLEYTAGDPVLLDLDGVAFKKERSQRSLLFPVAKSETGVCAELEDRAFDVYRVANRANDALLVHVSRMPAGHISGDGTFKRSVAFVPSDP